MLLALGYGDRAYSPQKSQLLPAGWPAKAQGVIVRAIEVGVVVSEEDHEQVRVEMGNGHVAMVVGARGARALLDKVDSKEPEGEMANVHLAISEPFNPPTWVE